MEEQTSTSFELIGVTEEGLPMPVAPVVPRIFDVNADEAEEYDLEELDDAQEQLLKWMLYTDEEAQEEDLDEMVDYDELGAEEYEDIMEEMEDLITTYDYDFQLGNKVMGTVMEVDEDGAYIEIGAKCTAYVPLHECSFAKLKSPLEVLRPGMRREFLVVEEEDRYTGQITLSLATQEATVFWQRVRQLQEEDITVSVMVESANKGGLLVKYGIYDGFVPVSQFGSDLSIERMDASIGQTVSVKFLEVDEENERLVFSNKRASASAPGESLGFKVGDVVSGVVQSVKPYGAFIDLGGTTGLLHVSQISHDRIMNVDKILSEGDKLKVMILSADKERGRMTLTTKKLEKTPGDMLRDPQLVFDGAEEMAKLFKERLEGIAMGASTRSMDSLLGSMDGYDNPANAIPSQGNSNSSDASSYAF